MQNDKNTTKMTYTRTIENDFEGKTTTYTSNGWVIMRTIGDGFGSCFTISNNVHGDMGSFDTLKSAKAYVQMFVNYNQ